MAINYLYPPTGEPVKKERWWWVAIYEDGSQLEQFEVLSGRNAIFHKLAEIDQERLVELRMVHVSQPPIHIPFPKGAKLVHFYRKRESHEILGDGSTGAKFYYQAYVVGYELDGVQHAFGINADDQVYLLDSFDNFTAGN